MIKQSSIIFALSLIIILIVNFQSIVGSTLNLLSEKTGFPIFHTLLERVGWQANLEASAYYEAKNLYNTGKLEEAKERITPYTTGTGKLGNYTRYLLGDIMYTVGSGETNTEKKIAAYQASLEAYTGSYQIEKNPDVEKNYRFVEEKLKELLKQPSPNESGSGWKSDEKDTQNTGSGKNETGSGWEKSDTGSTQQDEKNSSWTESWSGAWQQTGSGNNFSLGSNGWDAAKPLTEEEQRAIEAYTQQLMRLQKQQDEFTSYDAKTETMSAEEQMRQLFEEMSGFSPMDDGKKDW